jgi:hypothetical protein
VRIGDALVLRFGVAARAAVSLFASCDECSDPVPHCPYFPTVTVVTQGGGTVAYVSALVSSSPLSCSPTPTGATCSGGGDGRLHLEAPGFQPVDVDSTVTETPGPNCGCPRFTREPSTVTLNPS